VSRMAKKGGKKGGGKKGGAKKGADDGTAAIVPTPVYVPPPRPPTPPPRHTELPEEVLRAAETGNLAIVAKWLGPEDYGHVDATLDKKMLSGRTMLMAAAIGGQTAIAVRLLDEGAEVNRQDSNGDSALMLAASQCLRGYGDHTAHDTIVRYLLQNGARADLRNRDGLMAKSVINPRYSTGATSLDQSASRRFVASR
jgi:hypothetical protein